MFNSSNSISIPVSEDESDEFAGRVKVRGRRKRKNSTVFRSKAEFTCRVMRKLANWWPLLLFILALLLLLFEVSWLGRKPRSHETISGLTGTKPGFVMERKGPGSNLNRTDPTYHVVASVKELVKTGCLKLFSSEELEHLDIPVAEGATNPVKNVLYISEHNDPYAGGDSTFSTQHKEAGRFNLFAGYQTLDQRERNFKVTETPIGIVVSLVTMVDIRFQMRIENICKVARLWCLLAHLVVGMIFINLLGCQQHLFKWSAL